MKTSKYIAIAASIFALLLAGCGEEKPQAKTQTTPQAAPAKQVQAPQGDKVISKGKIVGTTTLAGGKTVQVEERIIETTDPFGKRVQEKRYFDASNGHVIIGYNREKDTTIKNEGKQLSEFKVK